MSVLNDLLTVAIIGGFFLLCISFFTKQKIGDILHKIWDYIKLNDDEEEQDG